MSSPVRVWFVASWERPGIDDSEGEPVAQLDTTVWTAPVRNLTWVAARFGHR
jgi:hypothetical protein